VTTAVPDDERIWVPQAKDVWFRPLMLNTLNGGWCNLLRVRKASMLARHGRHGASARVRDQGQLAVSGTRLGGAGGGLRI
jgi:hypothetical protein